MPLKPKKIPMRMCVACREMRPKAELLRVVKPQDGQAHIDFTGRGAYICPSEDCFKRARKTRALERALETSISPEVFDALEEQLKRGE